MCQTLAIMNAIWECRLQGSKRTWLIFSGASKTYQQQEPTISKNGYIIVKGRPCKAAEVSTKKTKKHGHAKCHFVASDIFNGKIFEDIVSSSHNCDVHHPNHPRKKGLIQRERVTGVQLDFKGNFDILLDWTMSKNPKI